MKNKRYGKIKLKNHLSNCFFDLSFLLFGMIGIAVGADLICIAIFFSFAIFDVIQILLAYQEKFEVNQGTIFVYKNRKIETINLPSKVTVVISCADMCTELAKRIELTSEAHMLKDDIAISLLEDISVEKVIKRLHDNGACLYTNCSVEFELNQNFVYSFLYNQSVLEEVLQNKNYSLIIPEKLLHKIDTKKLKGDIYIDKGF